MSPATQSSAEASYSRVLAISERVDWRIEEVLPADDHFDFSRPFLPESLVCAGALEFLTEQQRLALNHIRAHGYLGLFGVVEEMILPFVVQHARPAGFQTMAPVRALLRFAAEEAKHIELFRRFRDRFLSELGHPCGLVGPADAFAEAVLAHPPLAVALAILHIEWMTQRHWVEAVRGDGELDASFVRLLRYHWMEEAQHARLDDLLARTLAAGLDDAARAAAVDGYAAIVALLDGALATQTELDLVAFERVTGRTLRTGERERFVAAQHQSMRDTFLVAGITHPSFIATVEAIDPRLVTRITTLATIYRGDLS